MPHAAGVTVRDVARAGADHDAADWRPDLATVIAIAVVAYGAANLLHEGVGHGAACALAGCRPEAMSSIHFSGDYAGVTDSGRRVVAAGGSIANAAAGGVAWWMLNRASAPHMRVFLWLFAFVNLLQATGYLLFSGLGDVGDWAVVVRGWTPAWAFRAGLAIVGAAAYYWVARECARACAALVGAQAADRARRAKGLAWTAYFTGGVLYCVSGALNPLGPLLVLISAAAASLGGTSALLWCMSFLRTPGFAASTLGPVTIGRHAGWIAAGIAMAVVFVGVLGPGVRL
jgi:hypothetical protein